MTYSIQWAMTDPMRIGSILNSMKGFNQQMWKRQPVKASILVIPLLFSQLSTSVSVANQNNPNGTVAKQERRIVITPKGAEAKPVWSDADLALRAAMDADLSYSNKTGGGITQRSALAAWKRLLERKDLTIEQQIFAWWRIGSLYAYNFDRNRGETADFEQAEQAFAKVRQLDPDLISSETLNTATVYAGIPGPLEARTRRLSESFHWLATRSEKDIDRSAHRINRSGNGLDKKFFANIAHRESTLDERKQHLREQLAEHRESIRRQIKTIIVYRTRDDVTQLNELLKSIKDVAGPEELNQWEKLLLEKAEITQ